jgi:hypothetical protein
VLEKVESTLVEPEDDDTLEKNVEVHQVQSSECQLLGQIYARMAVCVELICRQFLEITKRLCMMVTFLLLNLQLHPSIHIPVCE